MLFVNIFFNMGIVRSFLQRLTVVIHIAFWERPQNNLDNVFFFAESHWMLRRCGLIWLQNVESTVHMQCHALERTLEYPAYTLLLRISFHAAAATEASYRSHIYVAVSQVHSFYWDVQAHKQNTLFRNWRWPINLLQVRHVFKSYIDIWLLLNYYLYHFKSLYIINYYIQLKTNKIHI